MTVDARTTVPLAVFQIYEDTFSRTVESIPKAVPEKEVLIFGSYILFQA